MNIITAASNTISNCVFRLKYRLAKSSNDEGYETMGDALRALLAKHNWELNKKEVFVLQDMDSGRYYADIDKPRNLAVVSQFTSPF